VEGLKWALYEQTIADGPCLFVIYRGSGESASEWEMTGWGSHNWGETEQSFRQTVIRFHTGLHGAASYARSQFEAVVLDYQGSVLFVGHSRGGSLATITHAIASNLRPEAASRHYTLAFASRPSVDTLGQGIEDHVYNFVLD
jgi:hypothetical protein